MPETVWPSVFKHPRLFDRRTENRSYLSYLESYLNDFVFDGDDSALSDADDGSDIDSEPGWETDIGADKAEDLRSHPPSTLRRFARGLSDEENYLHLNQND
jgi:hypothetical protein